ncbi:3-methyl-adenine DNA glycosylase I, constitutive [Candidatus Terasakiella magnetica]|uniref:3-methyl-adenine DNA glycosylase I, constitutive n=1 Tax=Candidatus Terasakiella magnetica TaxID=1867952 RepID=A0A1C3RJC1_9PROT|nr:DNA-3-methyladenine glycosylase I [Candidatus Terasakiella magnetica]SCA57365.1 3-methyl-adenine DNA glycosylase I, constitutive [Candidatus Terasakiella magnetica]
MTTCSWATKTPRDLDYHDHEWGVPVFEDHKHFEMLTLESAQSGLSWSTILAKREGYLEAFHQFDIEKVAKMGEADVERLVQFTGIVRHRQKIASTINNASAIQTIQKEFGSFSHYIWSFVDYSPLAHERASLKDVPGKTDLSNTIAKDLKKRGFKFLGTTTVYAYLQAIGMVNDHVVSCPQHTKTARLQGEVKKHKP